MKRLFLVFVFGLFAFLGNVEQADAGCICNRMYKPVCGVNGKTYSNSCVASCAKVRVRCAGKCPCKRPCPVFRLKKPAPGCRYSWVLKNGCKVPKLICSCKYLRCKPGTKCVQRSKNTPPFCAKACPIYSLKRPAPGCKYLWIMKNGCKVPKLVCSCKLLRCRPGTRCVQRGKNAPPRCIKSCPVFQLKRPAPGCKYLWFLKNGCKYPRLTCSCKLLRCKPLTRCVQSSRNAPPRCVPACICTKIYKPVCGVNNRTYGNACSAKCARVRVKCQGRCPCRR